MDDGTITICKERNDGETDGTITICAGQSDTTDGTIVACPDRNKCPGTAQTIDIQESGGVYTANGGVLPFSWSLTGGGRVTATGANTATVTEADGCGTGTLTARDACNNSASVPFKYAVGTWVDDPPVYGGFSFDCSVDNYCALITTGCSPVTSGSVANAQDTERFTETWYALGGGYADCTESQVAPCDSVTAELGAKTADPYTSECGTFHYVGQRNVSRWSCP